MLRTCPPGSPNRCRTPSASSTSTMARPAVRVSSTAPRLKQTSSSTTTRLAAQGERVHPETGECLCQAADGFPVLLLEHEGDEGGAADHAGQRPGREQRIELLVGEPGTLEVAQRGHVSLDVRLRLPSAPVEELVADARDLLDHGHHLRVALVHLEVAAVVPLDELLEVALGAVQEVQRRRVQTLLRQLVHH